MVGFQLDVYRGGHFATDYQRWEVEYSHYLLDLQPKLAVVRLDGRVRVGMGCTWQ